jgi:hypothetical protein
MRVVDNLYIGSETHYTLASLNGEQTLVAHAMNNSAEPYRIGWEISVYLPPSALIVLED